MRGETIKVHRRSGSGFTLIELLVVIVVLGVLASIVIPQFTNASDKARDTSTRALLKTLRVQLEVYKVQHDAYPLLSELWINLTERTDRYGDTDPAGEYGPYLVAEPLNQYTRSTTVVAPGTGTASDGWEFDEDRGTVAAVGFDEETGTYTMP